MELRVCLTELRKYRPWKGRALCHLHLCTRMVGAGDTAQSHGSPENLIQIPVPTSEGTQLPATPGLGDVTPSSVGTHMSHTHIHTNNGSQC